MTKTGASNARFNEEADRLVAEMRKVVERGWKNFPPELRHGYHDAAINALDQVIGDLVLNIPCADCRKLAVEKALEVFPATVRRAAAQAEKRDPGTTERLH
jgi:hypothetical protein